MTELVEEEDEDKPEHMKDTDSEDQHDQPLLVTKYEAPEYPGEGVPHVVSWWDCLFDCPSKSPGRGGDASRPAGVLCTVYSTVYSAVYSYSSIININITLTGSITQISDNYSQLSRQGDTSNTIENTDVM